jgi:hypothetical protein
MASKTGDQDVYVHPLQEPWVVVQGSSPLGPKGEEMECSSPIQLVIILVEVAAVVAEVEGVEGVEAKT